jgi:hypothetical protein
MNGSHDLALVLVALNNSCKKRIEIASRATAHLCNNVFFAGGGPHKKYAKTLGATGDFSGTGLLDQFTPTDYTKPLFPTKDEEANFKALAKMRGNDELNLAIGLLRMFDAERNSAHVGGEPRCNFHNTNNDFVVGGSALDHYGPLWFPIYNTVLLALSSIYKAQLSWTSPSGVQSAMSYTIKR